MMVIMMVYGLYALFGITALTTVVNANQDHSICYKCVSNYIVFQWERVHLSRNLRFGDEIAGDNKCLNSSHNHPTVRCIGDCALFTVVARSNDKDLLFGAYRDCASAGTFKQLVPQLDFRNKVEIKLSPVKKYERRVVFETCSDDYCNGDQPRRRNTVMAKSGAQSSLTFIWPLIFILFSHLTILI